jgi:hypothetical protein
MKSEAITEEDDDYDDDDGVLQANHFTLQRWFFVVVFSVLLT